MSAKDQVLMLLHQSTGWVSATDLLKWVGYSSASKFLHLVLRPLHKARLIEFDAEQRRARISPRGANEVEEKRRAESKGVKKARRARRR
jgi:hypothetical protein